MPAAAAKRSGEPKRPMSSTSARNSAVKMSPMPGRLPTIFPSGLVSTSSSRRFSRSAILSLVLKISQAISDRGGLDLGSGQLTPLGFGSEESLLGQSFRLTRPPGFQPPCEPGFAQPAGVRGKGDLGHREQSALSARSGSAASSMGNTWESRSRRRQTRRR